MSLDEGGWTEQRLQALIDEGVEESLTLEYKAGAALADNAKKEITKDVSAFANSAGGTLVYGIKEYAADTGKAHLPEQIDPIDRAAFSKERLEHVIASIRPRIEGVVIEAVPIQGVGSNAVVYVVEVPKGTTAHQALDQRYYRRYNFQSAPMADHEIRDVMGRRQHPDVHIALSLVRDKRHRVLVQPGRLALRVEYANKGAVYAQYVNGYVSIPESMADQERDDDEESGSINGAPYRNRFFANIHKDVVMQVDSRVVGVPPPTYYVTRYDPLLPGMSSWFHCGLEMREKDRQRHAAEIIHWSLFADNMPRRAGEVRVGDLELIDDREVG
jgi:hypothetical protein